MPSWQLEYGRCSQPRIKPGAALVEIQVIVIAPFSAVYCAISEGPFALPPRALFDQVRPEIPPVFFGQCAGVGRIEHGERRLNLTQQTKCTFTNKGMPEGLKVNSRYCVLGRNGNETFRLT